MKILGVSPTDYLIHHPHAKNPILLLTYRCHSHWLYSLQREKSWTASLAVRHYKKEFYRYA
jgi:hypothetical protein